MEGRHVRGQSVGRQDMGVREIRISKVVVSGTVSCLDTVAPFLRDT